MSKKSHTIRAVTLEDVPELAQLSADAFETDRQTEMKGLGKEPFDMKAYTLGAVPDMLKNPKCVILKVVDDETGAIMGYCNWGFRGLEPDEMPALEGRIQPPKAEDPPAPAKTDTTAPAEKAKAEPEPEAEMEDDPIKRLQAMTGADLQAWMTEVMPEGTRCLFIIGLSVSPKFQGRGVGSALLRWGTDVCDRTGAFAWVHSSEPAWPMYQKSGFKVIRELDVDLDAYAPMPPPNEGPGAKWGHYVFRYMKYIPGEA